MIPTKPFTLEMTIQASYGLLGRVGEPKMFGRFCMQHAPGSSLAGAVVSFVGKDEAGDNWREYQQLVSSEAALDVAAQIDALGMSTRAPDVSQLFDTSGCWTKLLLRVKKDEQTVSFEIGLQCSGFEGPDADALRRLLHTLCVLCGYQGFDHSVLGSPVAPRVAGMPDSVAGSSSIWSAPQFCCYCGHDVGGRDVAGRGYPEHGGIPCANAACQEPLLPHHSTCLQVGCGHVTPVSASFCWVCGVGVRKL